VIVVWLIVVYSRRSTGLSHIQSFVNLQTRIWRQHCWQSWWRYLQRDFSCRY